MEPDSRLSTGPPLPELLAGNLSSGPPGQASSANGAVIKRRAPIACRRCRRMRSKCVHDKTPPCVPCKDAGLGPDDCVFPVRGQPDSDREYRHPRVKSDRTASKRDPTRTPSQTQTTKAKTLVPGPGQRQELGPDYKLGVLSAALLSGGDGADPWDLLPPLPEIVDAVNQFIHQYFQLGFIPKQTFVNRLRQDRKSAPSVFVLLGILSISARFTPSLVARFGTGLHAAEVFIEMAEAIAVHEVYAEPDLQRCQGFYLLSIAQQGNGQRNRSYINLGIATRMAALMRLHREETYTLTNPTKGLVVKAESARRTLWMLHSQDNLHSGPSSPVSLVTSDITALLPSNEDDFANGREPKSRAALAGTPPAIENPNLISDPGRSLFASLIQVHHFWGTISRRAVAQNKSPRPWDPESEFSRTTQELDAWEGGLPSSHLWDKELAATYKSNGLDLAYLAVTTVARLCNIVLRKAYLPEMLARSDGGAPSGFWMDMSRRLFMNVHQLFVQIDLQFQDRTPDVGMGAQMAAFCVYSCGMLAAYLCKFPRLCPDPAVSSQGPLMLRRTLAILTDIQAVWPLAARWLEGLEKFANGKKWIGHEGSMADGQDPIPHALKPATPISPALPTVAPPDSRRANLVESPVLAEPLVQSQTQAQTQAQIPPPAPPQPQVQAQADAPSSTDHPPLPIVPEEMYLDPPIRLAAAALHRQSTQQPSSQHALPLPSSQLHGVPHQAHLLQHPGPHPISQPHHAQQHQQLHHQHQTQPHHAHQPHLTSQVQGGGASHIGPADGLGLLLEAHSHQAENGAGTNPSAAPFGSLGPAYVPSNPAHPADFYGPNDGYDSALQLFVEGVPPNMPNMQWVPDDAIGFGY